jgi:hypothetical protein
VDLAVCVAALGIVGALATVGMRESTRQARVVSCGARLASIGAGNAQFALANNDKMAGFLSEVGGVGTSQAHADEAVAILNSRGRPDIPQIQGWIPDPLYSHLALVKFQDRALSEEFNICPEDRLLMRWRRSPEGFDAGKFLPFQPTPSDANKRWPYSSSYEPAAAAYDRNQSRDVGLTSGGAVQRRLYQNGNTHNLYTIPGGHDLGPSSMSMVAMPSRKVHWFEEHQRHQPGIDLYFMYPDATSPILFFDGSVRVERSGDANNGWIPNQPASQLVTFVNYAPRLWDPPLANGQGFPATQVVGDSHRWTRNGLLGWDYLE